MAEGACGFFPVNKKRARGMGGRPTAALPVGPALVGSQTSTIAEQFYPPSSLQKTPD